MSRQFSFYLLPRDVEALICRVKSRLEICLIQPSSPNPVPVRLETPLPDLCYITAKDADIRMRYVPTMHYWVIENQSEVVEFSGCELNGNVLVRGRLYFQNDFLFDGEIFPKRQEFLAFADKLFRSAKKDLKYSKTLFAYVGHQAQIWRQSGGRFDL